MGKSKQAKEKKFDRNVEISAPILDPEIIKAIHTPPKGQKLDVKHGGFKALLSDLNSQDSTDELTPLNDNHVPSYIGISCAVSGYSNYSSYSKKPSVVSQVTSKTAITNSGSTPNRSRATSPVLHTTEPEVHHITIDKNALHSADEERKELTEKLTASATDRRRSPSPCIPPTEDDRHHGAYVGARYCPLPAPSKIVNKHIPLLGIDDEQDPDENQNEENKVEQRIASLYGGDFVEDWRESMTHKAKKEHAADQLQSLDKGLVNPKDLVSLRPTPPQSTNESKVETKPMEVPVPNVKVLVNVEKQFLNKLLTDENPPVPAQPKSPSPGPLKTAKEIHETTTNASDDKELTKRNDIKQREEPVVATTTSESAAAKPSAISRDDTIKIKSADMPMGVESKVIVADHNEKLATMGDVLLSIDPVSQNTSTIRGDIVTLDEPGEKFEVETQDDILTGNIMTRADTVSANPLSESITLDDTTQAQPAEILTAEAGDRIIRISSNEAPATIEQVEAGEQEASISPDFGQRKSFTEEDLVVPDSQSKEQHIEYEIRAQSPVDNESSPVKVAQWEGSGASACSTIDCEPEQKDQIISFEEPSSDSKDGRYYLGLLDKEKSFILEQVTRAETLLEQEAGSAELDEDTVGRLRSAIGKANLLINKKFNQFRELCEANINKKEDEQFATLNDDLAGFWDMLSIQVSDIQKSFENLWKTQKSKGEEISSPEETSEDQTQLDNEEATFQAAKDTKEKVGGGKPKLSAQKDQKRRERLQEHISQMKKDQAAKMSNENLLLDD